MPASFAERYIELVLSVGRHDADYVDAFYGPKELQHRAEEKARPLATIRMEAGDLRRELADMRPADEMERLRLRSFSLQLSSLVTRVEMLEGRRLSFDEESAALYDAVAPAHPEAYFVRLRNELEAMLPGHGPIPERLEEFRKAFIIRPDRLDRVFSAAVEESRRRTALHLKLPRGESFRMEYVTGKSWSGYNWYQGECRSLIQINTEFPITIDRAIDLASHEGYPGHHVYNALLETALVRERGWIEFTVYALFSPQSLIAEGTANFGIEMAYPGEERLAVERDVLYPLAGLDPSRAAEFLAVFAVTQKLGYAGNEAAREYLNGSFSREQAAEWLVNYALMSPDRAMQRTRFFDQYRSYVINYNLGLDLVRKHVEKRVAAGVPRWDAFRQLLTSPQTPSGLAG